MPRDGEMIKICVNTPFCAAHRGAKLYFCKFEDDKIWFMQLKYLGC